jgi:hypothetical protein
VGTEMQKLGRKTTIFLLIGGGMLLAGAALSLLHDHAEIRIISNIAVILGIVITSLSGFNSKWGGTVRRGRSEPSAKSGLVDKLEMCAYMAAALMFVITDVAATHGIFNDALTYTFMATVMVATVFWFWRRVFR